jgi:putative ABC transport system ATP-binding protein
VNSEQTLLSTRALTKIFTRGGEEIRALNGVSVQIQGGAFVAITGASGSGKSTLLYLLGLIDRPTSGQYLFDGAPTENLSDSDRSVLRNKRFGFIFQSFHLLPRMDALRNVAMPLEYARGFGTRMRDSEIQARAHAALTTVGLADRTKHRPNELSGGQRQRVAIARALVNDPAIIFADEPTGNLDSRNSKDIIDLFERLNDQGRTIVLVTHDPAIASRVPRQIVMNDGIIQEELHHATA